MPAKEVPFESRLKYEEGRGPLSNVPCPDCQHGGIEYISISRLASRVDRCDMEVQNKTNIYRSATRTRTPNLRAIGSKMAPMYLEPNMPGINNTVGVLRLSAGASGLKPTSA